MSSFTVKVSGIALSTTEAQLRDFFTFCGKISSLQLQDKGTAIIAFEKSSAAKTALMLDGGALDGAALTVKSDVVHQDDYQPPTSHQHHIEQSDKPRAGIAAEYLAKGYVLSDNILTRAIEIDSAQGISKRFLTYFQNLDQSVGHHVLGPQRTMTGKFQDTIDTAAQRLREVDQKGGYSQSFHGYYGRAIKSPFGEKVRSFYTDTSKQAFHIHEEARRIADDQKEKAAIRNAAPAPDAANVSEPVQESTAGVGNVEHNASTSRSEI